MPQTEIAYIDGRKPNTGTGNGLYDFYDLTHPFSKPESVLTSEDV